MRSFAFLRDDLDDADVDDCHPARRGAAEALAEAALREALTGAGRRRVSRDPSIALVVQVPSAEWVLPVRRACEKVADWGLVLARTGDAKANDRPERGNDDVASILARGLRVLGVSQSPSRYLPSALVACADLHLRLAGATDGVVAGAVEAVTGRRPRAMPPKVAQGLDFFEVVASIRGADARACVRRLERATASKATVDPSVASAPDFASLVGYGEAHAWGTRLLRDLAAWRADPVATPFASIDRHVALSSAPGLGKSTYVRALARAAGLPLVATSVAGWFVGSDGFLGGVLRAWDAAFASACARAPSILFLDEADALPNRSTMSEHAREWWTPLCTSVLLAFDALHAPGAPEVCVLAATNHGGRLDPALVRPGRLGRVIHVGPPSASELAAIARQHLREDELPAADLGPLGLLASGATGAQVVGWVKEARGAARAAGRPMRLADLADAVAPPDPSTPAERRRTALHEAGHAVAFCLLDVGTVEQVDLVSRGTYSGRTHVRGALNASPTRAEQDRLAVAMLCGRAAEAAILGEPSAGAGGDAGSDLARVTALVAAAHGSLGLGDGLLYRGSEGQVLAQLPSDARLRAAVEGDLARLGAEALALIRSERALVEAVAERLLAERVLTGDDLRALLADAPRRTLGDGGVSP